MTCRQSNRVIALLELLHQLDDIDHILCFTGSVDTAHRLSRMLELFSDKTIKAAEFSRLQPQSVRTQVLSDFKDGNLKMFALLHYTILLRSTHTHTRTHCKHITD